MSIEDITQLKNNSIKQTFVLLIDSKNRDYNTYPDPSNYVINFNTPFKNVIGFDIIDTSIPRTMYSIDKYNNTLYYYIYKDSKNYDSFNNYINDNNNFDITKDYDETFNGIFTKFEMPVGDYNLPTFIEYFNDEIKLKDPTIDFKAVSLTTPTDITDIITFQCSYPFILNMRDSTIAETLGFNLLIKESDNNIKYSTIDKFLTPIVKKKQNYNNKDLIYDNNYIDNTFKKLYVSCEYDYKSAPTVEPVKISRIIAPGMVCFTGEKYIILRSPEIEEHSFGSLAYSDYNLGIAKFRTTSEGFNDEKLYITKIPIREFHPIGKLSRLSLRFETADRKLYDFKGVNHNITLAIYYYEPKIISKDIFYSILNPNYKTNFNEYKYTNDEQEIINEQDDDEDDDNDDDNNNFSRDNINIYKQKELQFNY
jgi:hypothetical protein